MPPKPEHTARPNPGAITTSDRAKQLGKLGGQQAQVKRRAAKHAAEQAALQLAAAVLSKAEYDQLHALALECLVALQNFRLLPQPGAAVWRKPGASSE